MRARAPEPKTRVRPAVVMAGPAGRSGAAGGAAGAGPRQVGAGGAYVGGADAGADGGAGVRAFMAPILPGGAGRVVGPWSEIPPARRRGAHTRV